MRNKVKELFILTGKYRWKIYHDKYAKTYGTMIQSYGTKPGNRFMYMLGPKKLPAACWNWDRLFAPCWNWDADSPVVALAIKTRSGDNLGTFLG